MFKIKFLKKFVDNHSLFCLCCSSHHSCFSIRYTFLKELGYSILNTKSEAVKIAKAWEDAMLLNFKTTSFSATRYISVLSPLSLPPINAFIIL